MQQVQRLLPGIPDGWQCEIVYKSIRHIYFRIYPDKKIVRISAPARISEKTIRHAIAAKSAWLMDKVSALDSAPPDEPSLAIKGPTWCMVWGRKLPVVRETCNVRPAIQMDVQSGIIVRGPSGFDPERQTRLMDKWLRAILKARIQILLEKWEPAMGVAPAEFRLRKMRTRWGSCNTVAKRIWINSALVHPDPSFLEYVLVHELTHLLEPGHTPRFYQILERYLPGWKATELRLNQGRYMLQ